VPPLRLREVELAEQSARLARVVVRDRGLEVLALGRWLAELPPEPAEQADRRRVDRRGAQERADPST
jgi:hypothetical protein